MSLSLKRIQQDARFGGALIILQNRTVKSYPLSFRHEYPDKLVIKLLNTEIAQFNKDTYKIQVGITKEELEKEFTQKELEMLITVSLMLDGLFFKLLD